MKPYTCPGLFFDWTVYNDMTDIPSKYRRPVTRAILIFYELCIALAGGIVLANLYLIIRGA